MKVPENIFDQYASFVIDPDAYKSNPDLRQIADIILKWIGVAPNDVTERGLTVYRTRAVCEVYLKTRAGERYTTGGEWAKRTIGIDFSTLEVTPTNGGTVVTGTTV